MHQKIPPEIQSIPLLLPRKVIVLITIATVIAMAFLMRFSVLSVMSDDMRYFLLPWYEYFLKHGLHGIATINSNYNVPYLYLLWFSTCLHISPIVAIKSITLLFEALLAVVVYFISKDYYPTRRHIPIIIAISSLFIPTVVLQGALWGQCDIIFTTFLVACWWMMSKNKQLVGWTLFGIALAFKLQAIFFLPYMIYKWFTNTPIKKPFLSSDNKQLFYPLVPIVTIIVLALPAVALGRPFNLIFGVYAGQVNDPGTKTSLGSAASVFQLFVNMNDKSVLYLAKPAIFFVGAVVVGLFALHLLYIKRNFLKDNFTLPLLILLIIPYFLPFMHDRYFFAAEIFALLFAALTRRLFFVIAAILLQITALPLYAAYLWHGSIWPTPILALIQLSVIVMILYYLYKGSGSSTNIASLSIPQPTNE